MSLIFSVVVMLTSLIGCMIFHIELSYGLLVGMFAFMSTALSMGFRLKEIAGMMWEGVRESFIVIGILLLVSMMTGIWRACGTVPLLVVYGIRVIHPRIFVLCAFLLSCAISYLLGTSFGTCATIGVVMTTLCAVGGGNYALTVGAVISGAYFGDRASPASSCANLVAYLTGTELYDNVRRMMKDAFPALILAILIYGAFSVFYPLTEVSTEMIDLIHTEFDLRQLLLIPALAVLIAPFFRIKIKWAMAVSILAGCVLAVWIQGVPVRELPRILVFGYSCEGPLNHLFSGGGMISMLRADVMIIITATYSGIFNGTKMLHGAEDFLEKLSGKLSLYQITLISSFPFIMTTCNQTLALMMQAPLLRPLYEKHGQTRSELMLDLADSTVLTAGMIPWCLAISNPLEVLKSGPVSILFAFYLLLPCLVRLVRDGRSRRLNMGEV